MILVIVAGSLILVAIAGLAVAWPLIQELRGRPELAIAGESTLASDPLVELSAQRDSVYQALRELRFDHQVGKVSEADFKAFDAQLKGQAVTVLKQIDSLKQAEADPALDAKIEAEIAALRRDGPGASATSPDATAPDSPIGFCPKCGAKVKANDRFCGKCGKELD